MSEGQQGKKFGMFAGVFLPSILTILGVIMYLRLGWVVGQAGLIGTLLIILLAHVISITTGLSVSSIATDRKIKAGGIYYMLSRSLGLPIGGSIGLTIFIGTCLSISLYLIGFAESFNKALGLGSQLNDYRLTGSAALMVLTIIALISTNFALRIQYFILVAIVLSIVSIFMGTGNFNGAPPAFFSGGTADFATVFAIFFPAVTGFTAGVAMSGDLKDPTKAIPLGTMLAIGVGMITYLGLSVFIAYQLHPESLQLNTNLLVETAWIPLLVVAGIWGATLSSALGGVLGAPRIMQAIAKDKIAHRRLAEGVGATNEPRNALILCFLIAEAGILIGELDAIARIVTMFYLSAYGFINLSATLENWSSSEFRPSFRIPTWVSVIGFLSTFFIMLQLDPLAMLLAMLIMGGVFFYLRRRQMVVGSGNIWMNVWSNLVRAGLKLMDVESKHKRNWEPNILAFSVNGAEKEELRELGRDMAGNYGMISHIDLHFKEAEGKLFLSKLNKVNDPELYKQGVFGREVETGNPFGVMEALCSGYGFSGVEPNTILLPLSIFNNEPERGTALVAHIMALDHNLILLDSAPAMPFGAKKRIDIWWRGLSNNGELMLQLVKFLTVSGDWRQADFRLIMIGSAAQRKKRRYEAQKAKVIEVLEHFRLKGEVVILDNTDPPKDVKRLIADTSADADLVILGLPNPAQVEKQGFVNFTRDLTERIEATTILVRASSYFVSREIDLEDDLDEKVVRAEEID